MPKSVYSLLFLIVTLSFSSCTDTGIIPKETVHGELNVVGSKADPFARVMHEQQKFVDPETGLIPMNMRAKELAYASTLSQSASRFSETTWESRGPFNVGGRTRALVLDRTNENIMLAGAASGGVWKTVDAGDSWYKVSDISSNVAVTSMIQDPRPGHEQEWYYTTGELFGASQSAPGAFFLGNGVYKSADGGETWEGISSTTNSTPQTFDSFWEGLWRIAIDPSNLDQTELYVASYGNIYRSINGGTSWQTVLASSNASGSSYFTDVAVSSSGVVYATLSYEEEIISFGLGPNGGIYRSEDGVDFVDIRPLDFPSRFSRTVLDIDPSDENRVYFLSANVDSLSGFEGAFFNGTVQYCALWRYDYLDGDGTGAGGEWTELSQNLPQGDGPFDDFYSQSGYDLTIRVHPTDPQTILIGGTNLYMSTDGFTTDGNDRQIGGYGIDSSFPAFFVYPDHHPDVHESIFLPSNPDVMLSATDGGVYRTDDLFAEEVTWTSLNRGYLTTQVYGLGIEKEEPSALVVAGFQDNGNYYTSTEQSDAEWTLPLNGDGAYTVFARQEDYVMMSIQQGRVFKCLIGEDGFLEAFERIDPGLEQGDHEFIHPYVLDPQDDGTMYFPFQNKLYYHNGIDTMLMTDSYEPDALGWEVFQDSVDATGRTITAISIAEDGTGRIYLGTNNEKVYRIDDPTDPASPFVDITDPALPAGHIDCIAIDPLDADKAMIVYTNYNIYSLYYTENAGEDWEKVAGNLEQFSSGTGNGPSCRYASIHRWHPDSVVYYVGTSVGLYSTGSLDGLDTEWTREAEGTIGNSVVSYVESRTVDKKVFVGTHGAGVFSATVEDLPLPTSLTVHKPSQVRLSLSPVPATETLQVDCSGLIGQCQIMLLNSGGQVVRQLNTQGAQRPIIDLRGLNAGLYHLVIEWSSGVLSEPFIKL